MQQMKATVETEQNEWLRGKALGVFERGVRAMTDEEMQDLSHDWLAKVAKGSYLAAISSRDSPEFARVQRDLSPVDHINVIFQLLPGTIENEDSVYPLAWSFWEQAQLLSDTEILQF